MNILQIISGIDVNGALVYAKLLAEQLLQRGHRVIVVTRPNSWIATQDTTFPVLLSNLKRLPTGELSRFKRIIREEQIDLIHTHMTGAHNFGAILKLLTGVPLIATAHCRKFQLQWQFNDLVIANSKSTADYLRSVIRLPMQRIRTIHCFADIPKFLKVGIKQRNYYRRELHTTQGEFLVGIVGEVVPRKGHHVLFEALPEILKEVPSLKLAIIGGFHRNKPYTQRLRALQLKHGLFRCIKWLGRRSNVNEYMAAFDLMVVPSIEEPLGLVAAEAQAASVPIIASDVGGLPEIVSHNVSGWLVQPSNPRALAQAIIHVAKNPETAKAIAHRARLQVAEKFSPIHLTNLVEDAYKELLLRVGKKRAA